ASPGTVLIPRACSSDWNATEMAEKSFEPREEMFFISQLTVVSASEAATFRASARAASSRESARAKNGEASAHTIAGSNRHRRFRQWKRGEGGFCFANTDVPSDDSTRQQSHRLALGRACSIYLKYELEHCKL